MQFQPQALLDLFLLAAAEPRLTPATNLLISRVAMKAKGYAMVKRLGVHPSVTSVLVGPTADVSSQQLHGLTASQLPEKVYEVDLQALATRQYLAACGCGMNVATNIFCKHAWVALTTMQEDAVDYVKPWATTSESCSPCMAT